MSAESVTEHDARHERACLVALSSLAGIGPATVRACARSCGAAAAWDALRSGRGRQISAFDGVASRTRDPETWARLTQDAAVLDAEAVLARHEAAGQRVVAFGEAGYPERLVEDHEPPAVLFLAGSDAALARPTVAIVGTRNATRLGRETAGSLAAELTARGVSVVSGLALGIDGAAHQALVGGGGGSGFGAPVGVVATGLERAYPRRHQLLQQQIAASGLLVSESPIGSEPARWRFPARNRIIAGLAVGTLTLCYLRL
ncbi:MAG: smf [Ilumatobacteraceae bacterium]|nr:smf [Ilumatobacteraceae bacterium]